MHGAAAGAARRGFHHLGSRVHDVDRVSAQLTEDFGPTVQDGRSGGGGTRFAHSDTCSVMGLSTGILWSDPSADRLTAAAHAAVRGSGWRCAQVAWRHSHSSGPWR